MAKGSLTFPIDALAAMQELSALDAPPPVSTQVRKYASTEGLTEASAPVRASLLEGVSTDLQLHGSKDLSEEVSAEGSTPVRQEASKPARKAIRKEKPEEGSLTAESLVAFVEERLTSREPLIGGVKATVDMSPDLSSRAKRYLADHRGQSTRQILIELFDAFLTVKGY